MEPILSTSTAATSPQRAGVTIPLVSSAHDRHRATDHLLGDLKGRTISGAAVTISAQTAKFFLTLASTVVLARFFGRSWKFAFVRNPYSRAVSLYHYLLDRRYIPATTTFGIFCSYLEQRAYEPLGLYNHKGLNQLNPQVNWLFESNGRPIYDFLGKFENLEQDFEQLREALQLPKSGRSFPQRNVTNHKPSATYYGERERRIVAQVYAADFDRLKYDIEQLP